MFSKMNKVHRPLKTVKEKKPKVSLRLKQVFTYFFINPFKEISKQ